MGPADDQMLAMGLLSKALHLKSPHWRSLNVTFAESFSFIPRRELYLPMNDGGNVLFFGPGIDYEQRLPSYQGAMDRIIPNSDWREDLEVGMVLLELVDCATEHFVDVL